jgi:hypothetical protein
MTSCAALSYVVLFHVHKGCPCLWILKQLVDDTIMAPWLGQRMRFRKASGGLSFDYIPSPCHAS